MATHDWTLAGLLNAASREVWMSQIDLRRALPRDFGRSSSTLTNHHLRESQQQQKLQIQIDRAIQLLRDEVTVDRVDHALRQKYERRIQRP